MSRHTEHYATHGSSESATTAPPAGHTPPMPPTPPDSHFPRTHNPPTPLICNSTARLLPALAWCALSTQLRVAGLDAWLSALGGAHV